MQVVTDTSVRAFPSGSIVTIGAYDGVHRGHQAVIAELRRRARAEDLAAVVVTFDQHPASVVRPESAPKLLTDLPQKLELLEGTGLDGTVVVRFDEARARESAEDFVAEVLVGCAGARGIVVGEDFHFGYNRRGNVAMLRAIGAEGGFDVEPLPLVPRDDGVDEPVSSTAIRRALAGGEVDVAARLLGRAHEVRGTVVMGDQRGRTIGFPTANVEVPKAIALPADGVYAGWYVGPGGDEHPCAINIGRRPTFYEHAEHSLLEAHLLDFEGDLYDQRARVRFVAFLRSERKFEGIDALATQLKRDIEGARAALAV